MAYMTNRTASLQHEWWKDQRDPQSQRAFLESYRQAQRDRTRRAWTRILSLVLMSGGIAYLANTLVGLS